MKLDLTKTHKSYYIAKARPELMQIEEVHYLSVMGKGDPSEAGFAASVQALYSTAYTIKFACKAQGQDFVVPKLEGQWWYDTEKYEGIAMCDAPAKIARSEWEYRLLIRLPHFVTGAMISAAKAQMIAKKEIAGVADVMPYTIAATAAVQMLHTGPYANEPETLAHMLAFIEERKLLQNGPHHEIYLSDLRKTAPEKLKTILLEPVKTG